MENLDFTDSDKEQLAYLQSVADEKVEQAYERARLPMWQMLLFGYSAALVPIVLSLPTTKGVDLLSALFVVLSLGWFTLFLFVGRRKSKAFQSAEEKFRTLHGRGYDELCRRRRDKEREEFKKTSQHKVELAIVDAAQRLFGKRHRK